MLSIRFTMILGCASALQFGMPVLHAHAEVRAHPPVAVTGKLQESVDTAAAVYKSVDVRQAAADVMELLVAEKYAQQKAKEAWISRLNADQSRWDERRHELNAIAKARATEAIAPHDDAKRTWLARLDADRKKADEDREALKSIAEAQAAAKAVNAGFDEIAIEKLEAKRLVDMWLDMGLGMEMTDKEDMEMTEEKGFVTELADEDDVQLSERSLDGSAGAKVDCKEAVNPSEPLKLEERMALFEELHREGMVSADELVEIIHEIELPTPEPSAAADESSEAKASVAPAASDYIAMAHDMSPEASSEELREMLFLFQDADRVRQALRASYTRRELQEAAKAAGVKANLKSVTIVKELLEKTRPPSCSARVPATEELREMLMLFEESERIETALRDTTIKRRELQSMAKKAGVKANQKSVVILEQLLSRM